METAPRESGPVSEIAQVPESVVEEHEPETLDEINIQPVEPPAAASSIDESSTWVEELRTPELEPLGTVEPTGPMITSEPARPTPIPAPIREAGTNAEWPSARAIFAAQGKRPLPTASSSRVETARLRRRKAAEPEPTDALAPAQWTMPLWIGWFPTVLLALVLGTGGVALAYAWAVESNAANFAMGLALREEKANAGPIDVAAIPRGGWWISNASHLTAWAMAQARSNDGQDHSEEIRSLLESARGTSQLAARARFLLEPAEIADGAVPSDLSHLGRPRDVVTLVWTARRLRKAAKPEASLRVFRSAMEIASKAVWDGSDLPGFNEDPQVRRYALPREELLTLVVREHGRGGRLGPRAVG